MPRVTIERLGAGSGARLKAIRLRALEDAPEAFSSTLDEATTRSMEQWERARALALYGRAGFLPTGEESVLEVSGKRIREVQMALALSLS